MNYEIGEIYEIHGQQRKVLAVEPELVTTTDLDYKEPVDAGKMTLEEAKSEAEKLVETAEEKAKTMQAEAEKALDEAKSEAATLKARASAPDYSKMLAFVPLEKCNKEQLSGIAGLVNAPLVAGIKNDEMAEAIKKHMN